MFYPVTWFIGLRYVFSRHKEGFISFVSFISVLGIALGVTALITVLSVMNGFEKEMRQRILNITAHLTVHQVTDTTMSWSEVRERLAKYPEIVGLAPSIQEQGLLTSRSVVRGVLVKAILPKLEEKVSISSAQMQQGQLTDLVANQYRIVLGHALARALGVTVGDPVTLIIPQTRVTPAGLMPRFKRFTVSGIFSVGMYEYDSALSFIHLEDGQTLFRNARGQELTLKLRDPFLAPGLARSITEELDTQGFIAIDWTTRHTNLFQALRTEKRVMFIILFMIVAVAAFNVLSALMMLVHEKRSDIAVLRSIGASPGDILKIFLVQGCIIGLVGIVLGSIGGALLALNVESIVHWSEAQLGISFLPEDIYIINDLPSDLQITDIVVVNLVAFLLCVMSTLYPAFRAARTKPVEALRYE